MKNAVLLTFFVFSFSLLSLEYNGLDYTHVDDLSFKYSICASALQANDHSLLFEYVASLCVQDGDVYSLVEGDQISAIVKFDSYSHLEFCSGNISPTGNITFLSCLLL